MTDQTFKCESCGATDSWWQYRALRRREWLCTAVVERDGQQEICLQTRDASS